VFSVSAVVNDFNKHSPPQTQRTQRLHRELIRTHASAIRYKLRVPEKVSVTVNVDADVLEWFRAQGEEFQQRINAALRIYAEAHKELRR
jgi:uncharacterized protein (DUF4415 family)